MILPAPDIADPNWRRVLVFLSTQPADPALEALAGRAMPYRPTTRLTNDRQIKREIDTLKAQARDIARRLTELNRALSHHVEIERPQYDVKIEYAERFMERWRMAWELRAMGHTWSAVGKRLGVSGEQAGHISDKWAEWMGLPENRRPQPKTINRNQV